VDKRAPLRRRASGLAAAAMPVTIYGFRQQPVIG
jgi:hypothetical protein